MQYTLRSTPCANSFDLNHLLDTSLVLIHNCVRLGCCSQFLCFFFFQNRWVVSSVWHLLNTVCFCSSLPPWMAAGSTRVEVYLLALGELLDWLAQLTVRNKGEMLLDWSSCPQWEMRGEVARSFLKWAVKWTSDPGTVSTKNCIHTLGPYYSFFGPSLD